MDSIIHLSGTNFLKPVLKTNWKNFPGILAFTHIVLRSYEAFAKHLQGMPVKVADRDDTGLCRCK